MQPKGFTIGKTTFYWWSGAWSLYDRGGVSRLCTKQCICHRFTLFIGPFGIERQRKDT